MTVEQFAEALAPFKAALKARARGRYHQVGVRFTEYSDAEQRIEFLAYIDGNRTWHEGAKTPEEAIQAAVEDLEEQEA